MLFRRIGILGMLLVGAGCAPVRHVPVIVPVSFVYSPSPHFPMQAVRQAHEGTVIVLALVDVNGLPIDLKVEKSSGYRELDRAALVAVHGWTFKPETVDGVPRRSYARVPINFNFGAQRQQIQQDAANRPLLQYTPRAASQGNP